MLPSLFIGLLGLIGTDRASTVLDMILSVAFNDSQVGFSSYTKTETFFHVFEGYFHSHNCLIYMIKSLCINQSINDLL